MTDIWSEALEGLQPRLGAQTFDLWLRPLALRQVERERVHITAPNRFMKEWFETHYLNVVRDEIRARTSRNYDIQVEVHEVEEPAPAPAALAPTGAISVTDLTATAASPTSTTTAPRHSFPPPLLSPRYRFDTFIKGAGNELAASATWAAAQEPGRRFNPLFIYGGVGLGKTHLLHALGHHILRERPHLRIALQSSERFMNEFISAVRSNSFDEFRRRYREDCDVLLIDDIQFIAGRDRTMDEFFHVFNALYEAGKQIVVTADRIPADMAGMEERLTSRLNWGLVTDIKPPDFETRAAIIRQKAEEERIDLDPRIASHIATLVRTNVRELEGALVRVTTFAALKGLTITEEFVNQILGEHSPPSRDAVITIEAVQKAVAAHFSVRIADLKGPRRHKGIARPRMIAMYLCRQLTSASFPELGLRFGGKDHSTVISACKRIEALQSEEPEVGAALSAIRAQLAVHEPN
jgi:chromosomal replication initiator protein